MKARQIVAFKDEDPYELPQVYYESINDAAGKHKISKQAMEYILKHNTSYNGLKFEKIKREDEDMSKTTFSVFEQTVTYEPGGIEGLSDSEIIANEYGEESFQFFAPAEALAKDRGSAHGEEVKDNEEMEYHKNYIAIEVVKNIYDSNGDLEECITMLEKYYQEYELTT